MNTKINLSKEDLNQLNAIKKALLTDQQATFTSYGKCQNKLQLLAEKYNVDIQTMYDAATFKLLGFIN